MPIAPSIICATKPTTANKITSSTIDATPPSAAKTAATPPRVPFVAPARLGCHDPHCWVTSRRTGADVETGRNDADPKLPALKLAGNGPAAGHAAAEEIARNAFHN